MSDYATLPKEYVDTNDYHVFEAELLVDGVLKIKGRAGCGKVETTKKIFLDFLKE